VRGLAALLGFAVPGLGHILQGLVGQNRGRLAKGLLFFVVLNGMFLFGMSLGQWRNVYLPQYQAGQRADRKVTWFGKPMPNLVADLYTRLQYVGQFWIGMPAWPALWNYYMPDAAVLEPWYESPGAIKKDEQDSQELRKRKLEESDRAASDMQFQMDKTYDIGWVYTVIAGVLNLLVIYDAWAGSVIPRPAPSSTPTTPPTLAASTSPPPPSSSASPGKEGGAP
jgi:hypothetical protein